MVSLTDNQALASFYNKYDEIILNKINANKNISLKNYLNTWKKSLSVINTPERSSVYQLFADQEKLHLEKEVEIEN